MTIQSHNTNQPTEHSIHTGPGQAHTRQDDVAVEVLADVDVALHDRVIGELVHTGRLLADQVGLEEHLRATEALVADSDDLAVGQLVVLLEGGRLGGELHLGVEVQRDVAELLLDVTDDFTLGGGGESITTLSQDLHEVVSEVAAGHVETGNGVRQRETLVDGHDVGDTVTRVEHDTRGTTRGVQRQHGLDRHVESRGVEGLEDDLGHLLTVALGVDGSLREQDGVLLGSHTQLVVEGVVPDLLHVVPVGHDTVLDGVAEREDTTLGLRLITDVRVLLPHTNHDTMVTRATDDGRWRVLAGRWHVVGMAGPAT